MGRPSLGALVSAQIVAVALFGAALLVWLLARAVGSLVLRVGPDEWLLQIRNGVLVRAGIGITAVRLPPDRLVRFPASVQRVRFRADVLSKELLPVTIEAFALWSVLPEDPLLAARQLGLASTRSGRDQHLLSRQQYHAFQQAFSSMVRKNAGQFELAALCRDPGPLGELVLREAIREMSPLGARIDGVSIIEARPADAALLVRLSAEVDEEIARTAARAKDETQREQDQLSAATALARERSRIANDQLLEEHREQLAALSRQHEALALQSAIALDRSRAQSQAEILRIVAQAELERSSELRAHEIARLRIETLGETLKSWPISQAHFIGLEGPVATVERMLDALPVHRWAGEDA